MRTKDAAIEEIKSLIERVSSLKMQKRYSTDHVRWMTNVKNILEDIFGKESRYFIMFQSLKWELQEMSPLEITLAGGIEKKQQQIYTQDLDIAEGILQSALDSISSSSVSLPIELFWEYIHPKIRMVSESRYMSSHYADSVEAAFKEINSIIKNIVKQQIGKELDGLKLMQHAFSSDKPILKLTELNSESDRNVQLGYQQIFSGAMIGIRNPKAHENLVINKDRAMHLIFLASLLMHKVDESTINTQTKV